MCLVLGGKYDYFQENTFVTLEYCVGHQSKKVELDLPIQYHNTRQNTCAPSAKNCEIICVPFDGTKSREL